jgi:hypothetical protein
MGTDYVRRPPSAVRRNTIPDPLHFKKTISNGGRPVQTLAERLPSRARERAGRGSGGVVGDEQLAARVHPSMSGELAAEQSLVTWRAVD